MTMAAMRGRLGAFFCIRQRLPCAWLRCSNGSRVAHPRVVHGVQAEQLVLHALRQPVEARADRADLAEAGVELLEDRVAGDAEERAAERPGRVAGAEQAVCDVADPGDPEEVALVAGPGGGPVGGRASALRLARGRDRL